MPDHNETLNFLVLLAVIVAAAKGAGWLGLRLGQPVVLGELLAGVILGPSLTMVLATTIITPPLLRAAFPAAPLSEGAAIEAAFADADDR